MTFITDLFRRTVLVPVVAASLVIAIVLLPAVFSSASHALWQEEDGDGAPETAYVDEENSGPELAALRKEFNQTRDRWVEALKELRLASTMYFALPRDEAAPWKDRYEAATQTGNIEREKFEELAVELFDRLDEPDADLLQIILRVVKARYDRGQYTQSLELNKKLLPFMLDDDRAYMLYLSSLAMLDRYDETREFVTRNPRILNDELIESVHEDARDNYYAIQYLHEGWIREQELREQEQEADDLPRVQIKTSKGTITVELFENEAPLAVNNFVALCESGFYDGLIFHRVINHFMAQTGGYDDQQQHRQLGYTIEDEFSREDARHHFRGSLAMARTNAEHSGSSEFYFTFAPKPGLDGSPLPERRGRGYTVFGRVIAGWDVLDSLTRTFEVLKGEEDERKEVPIIDAVPDHIISTTVIRKRDHEYAPTPFAGSIQMPAHHGHDH
ncbi:MAG: peptidylprolyl isomerase [Planctomycetota bacterium]